MKSRRLALALGRAPETVISTPAAPLYPLDRLLSSPPLPPREKAAAVSVEESARAVAFCLGLRVSTVELRPGIYEHSIPFGGDADSNLTGDKQSCRKETTRRRAATLSSVDEARRRALPRRRACAT